MIKKTITPEALVDLLNDAMKYDRQAIENLINTRVDCNEALAAHPTIQVMGYKNGESQNKKVGLLGIVNGLFGVNKNGWGCICADFDDETKQLRKFKVDYNLGNSKQ